MATEPLNKSLHQSVIDVLKRLPDEAVSCFLVATSDEPSAIFTVKTAHENTPAPVRPERVSVDVYRGKDDQAGEVAEMVFHWNPDQENGCDFCIPFELQKGEGLTAYQTVIQQDVWPFFFVTRDATGLVARINLRNNISAEQREQMIREARQAVNGGSARHGYVEVSSCTPEELAESTARNR